MIRYILKRILLMIPVMLGVALIIFTIMYFVPGDPVESILGKDATPEDKQAQRVLMGLDRPYIVQLGNYLYRLFIKFDFGTSYVFKNSVFKEITVRFPRTLSFAVACMLINALIGIPLGITAAVHQNGLADRLCMFVALLGVSLPNFWVAIMLVLLFALHLRWLPAYGFTSVKNYILPVVATSLHGIGGLARQTRSSMLEVIRSDYVTTARAKGLSERTILYKHALPNGLIPVITMVGQSLGMSLAGALIIENVFSIPGMGMYLTAGVTSRDYPIVRGVVVFLALAFSIIMLTVDLAYAFADPRIKAQYENLNRKREKVKSNA